LNNAFSADIGVYAASNEKMNRTNTPKTACKEITVSYFKVFGEIKREYCKSSFPTAASVKAAVFWVVAPCSVIEVR
jgi:hypothetical protein